MPKSTAGPTPPTMPASTEGPTPPTMMSTKGGSVVLTTAAAAKIAVKTTTPGKRCEISHQCYFSIGHCFIIYLFASKTVINK
jgi:hypothetical protein